MNPSSIEWTEKTWNPTRGCSAVDKDCANCYAKTHAGRFKGKLGHPYELGFKPRIVPEKLDEPLRLKTPSIIFANSMSDLFHKDFPDEHIAKVFDVMVRANHHKFQVLTKRPERMKELLNGPFKEVAKAPHILWGTSVGHPEALSRVQILLETDVAVRMLSVEPLHEDLGDAYSLKGIDWVIVGGESGHGARPMELEWARQVRDIAVRDGAAFFMKQLGGARDKRGAMEVFPEDLRIRDYPAAIPKPTPLGVAVATVQRPSAGKKAADTRRRKSELSELETIIREGLKKEFQNDIDVGRAFARIKAGKLFKPHSKKFRDYVDNNFDLTLRRAQQLINASGKIDHLLAEKRTIVPNNEAQARPLGRLKGEALLVTWDKALELAGGKQPTSKQVEQAVVITGNAPSRKRPEKQVAANGTKDVAAKPAETSPENSGLQQFLSEPVELSPEVSDRLDGVWVTFLDSVTAGERPNALRFIAHRALRFLKLFPPTSELPPADSSPSVATATA